MNMISAVAGPSPGTDFLRDSCNAHFVHSETSFAILEIVSLNCSISSGVVSKGKGIPDSGSNTIGI